MIDSISEIQAVVLDLDGVVYEGEQAIEGAAQAIETLWAQGIEIYFVTNNSGRHRTSIAAKLNTMGIAASHENVITSGYAAAVLVGGISGSQQRVLVFGSDELESELAQCDIRIVSELPADILVVGFDKTFNYEKLSMGLQALLQGALFVACNKDRVFPAGGNTVLPGCGPIVASLEWAWGKDADYMAGKPNTMMLEMIARKHAYKPHEILVVGDTLESDIAMANRFGSPSVWITATEENNTKIFPSRAARSIRELPAIINKRG